MSSKFGLLFTNRMEVERFLRARSFPAPLGNITKTKPDGSVKHRLIQDLNANQVNRAARVPERQVLPRPRDHAAGLARAAFQKKRKRIINTLIMDFENAFMTVPIMIDERKFNC